MPVSHPYFETLSAGSPENGPDVCWERELPVNGDTVEVCLWTGGDDELTAEKLDAFAAFLARLEEADKMARAAIAEYLTEDGEYLNFHITEIEDADYPDNPEEFARAMRLESISLWTEELPDCDSIVMDYMIDREKSDEILAVKLFADGGICGIDWES
ncbi:MULTISPECIES: DUF2004 domain-containing protein [Neisseria]|uniref:DUF2004 domain-containing protein n=2 Tax=Neisseria TaxID=482 RepID=A0AAU8VG17_NEILA|nr:MULTISPECIES: DUF2004 domain-containing protein [Neisseria]ARB04031.1 hypothetical protein B2G52_03255 [Neisseria lactamica]MBS0040065.1 DUF2004 domain-containing protein [Neisseria sp. Marseille-Q1983]MBW3878102.1 DUF2004 domain-containing protein [Neisseria meningitidis]CBX22496.1 unnamed protein product [Neisseria lactamica Y92-1009]